MNFYFDAAKTLDRLETKQGSIKSVLATLPEKDKKRTAALVIETLKYKPVLNDVIANTNLIKEERKKLTSPNLALVLVHDLLLSGGIQAGDGPIKQAVLRHKTRLRGEFQKIKIKRGASSNADLVRSAGDCASRIPRYVRVNTLVCSTEQAIESLLSRGFTRSDPFESDKGFIIDAHIPDLLAFSPQSTFQEDPFYKAGKFILQDKASCFPAVVLSPPAADDALVIDATAAPGNKTSFLSAIMKNKGKLLAFERDKRRFKTLTTMLAKAGCKNTEPLNVDFLTVDPTEPKYERVTHILLDPSCSGSGIVNRLDHLLDTGIPLLSRHSPTPIADAGYRTAENEKDGIEEEDRLQRLSTFQVKMVKHAMKFPGVQKIVYSTCSIHSMENEHVVRQCLNSDEAEAGNFHLAEPSQVLPKWPRRGYPEELDDPSQATSLIRCSPNVDATNGFFVSCFVRGEATSCKKRAGVDEQSEVRAPPKKKRKKNKKPRDQAA